MKKIVGLLLCFAMAFSATACGGEEKKEAKSEESSVSFQLGEIGNGKYENKFVGIGCELGSDWTFLTEEEILEKNNLVNGQIDEDIAEAIENADLVYDMEATYSDEMSNVNINIENIGEDYYEKYDVSEIQSSQKDMLISAFEDMGAEGVEFDLTTVSIDGEEYDAFTTYTSNIGGMEMFQKSFGVKCGGKYLANVTITTFEEDFTDDIIDSFYTVK